MAEQSERELIISKEPWRNADKSARVDYNTWVNHQHLARQSVGVDKYGDIFQGDPTEQGIEECLDQLFYLYWAKKKIEFVEGQRNLFRGLLEEVMESNDPEIHDRIFIALRDS